MDLKIFGMKLKELKNYFHNELKLYSKSERQSIFLVLCETYLNLKPHQIVLNYEMQVLETLFKSFESVLIRLQQNEPIQYILGRSCFFGLEFLVTPSVLIPRPETEELVAWVVKHYNKSKSLRILELGTGSGCVAITLAKEFPNAHVYAMDISFEALKVARANAQKNQVDITFFKGDILNFNSPHKDFDIVISNPPYICKKEEFKMAQNVTDFEPHLALFVDDNSPLIFYDAIKKIISLILNSNGLCFLEINESYGLDIIQLYSCSDFKNLVLKKDSFGKDRMVKIEKK